MNPVIGAVAFLVALFGGAMAIADFDDIASEKFCIIWKIVTRAMMIGGFVLLIVGAATEG